MADGQRASHPPGPEKPLPVRFLDALRHTLCTLALAIALILVQNVVITPSPAGRELKQAGARLLQVRLSDTIGWRGDPVRIVDISALPPSSPAAMMEPAAVTDRKALKRYLLKLALASPAAIGIDIIFDPPPDGSLSGEDTDFLDLCRNLKDPSGRSIPVFVGIYSTLALGPEAWLGDPRFGPLGASILVPAEGPGLPTTTMIKEFTVKIGARTVVAHSLSYSLVKAVRIELTNGEAGARWAGASHRARGVWLHDHWPGLFADSAPLEHDSVKANQILIDFGMLQKMIDNRIPANDVTSHVPDEKTECKDHSVDQKCIFHNEVVIIGRATPGQAFDSFITPSNSLSKEPIPGVYLHAAAVDTQMEAPLFELNAWGEALIDLILLACLALSATSIHLFLGEESVFNEVTASLEVVANGLLAAAVLAAGVGWVDSTGIFWADFFVVAFVQLFHSPIERAIGLAALATRKYLPFLQRRAATQTALWIFAIGLGAAGVVAQEPKTTGRIIYLSGTVTLRPFDAPAGSPPIRLSPKRDVWLALHEGDLLQASQDGVVKLVLRSLKVITLEAKDKQFRLPHARTDEEIAAGADVLKIGIPAASRDVAPLLWSPAEDSSIRAQAFHLRWNPPHTPEPFSVTISREDGTKLWSVESVDSAQGGLSPQQEAAVAALLVQERSQSERQRYSVTISSDLQGAPKATFSVVSADEEARELAGLAHWDQVALDPLVRAIARAETWRAANLIYDAAEEYDRALIMAPESTALLEVDLAVHRQIGNLAQSQELANRLRDISAE